MDNNQNCPPPSLIAQKLHMADLNLKMVGIVKDIKTDILEVEYKGSNKFWDESDVFSINGETVLLYRSSSDANVKAGDKIIADISGMYWDPNHERNVGKCTWVMRVLTASKVEPYTFDSSVAITQVVHSYFLPFMILFLLLLTLVVLLKSRKKKKKTHH